MDEILSLGALAGAVVGSLALWTTYIGKLPLYPDGKRVVAQRGMVKVHVVAGDGVIWEPEEISQAFALAVWSTVSQWIWMIHDKKWTEIESDMDSSSDICIHIVSDAKFNEQGWISDIESLKAVNSKTGSEFGSGLPMITIRVSAVQEAVDTGEPLIGEMIKILVKSGGKKALINCPQDTRLWCDGNGQDSIQLRARKLYSETSF